MEMLIGDQRVRTPLKYLNSIENWSVLQIKKRTFILILKRK